MHLCKTLLIAICFIAATSTTDLDCLVLAGGRLFNLCPFKDPLTVPFDVLPYLNGINFNFNLVGNNLSNCDGTGKASLKLTYPDIKDCTDYTVRPTYSLTKQELDLHILKISYQLSEKDKFEVNLYCNPKGSQDNKVDFFVNSLEEGTITLSGYSFYGCPMAASTSDNGFLSFKN